MSKDKMTIYVSKEIEKRESYHLRSKTLPTGQTWKLIESNLLDAFAASVVSTLAENQQGMNIRKFLTVNNIQQLCKFIKADFSRHPGTYKALTQKKILEKTKALFRESVALLLQEIEKSGIEVINDCFFVEKKLETKYQHTGIQEFTGAVINKNETHVIMKTLDKIPARFRNQKNLNQAIIMVSDYVRLDQVWQDFPSKMNTALFKDIYARGYHLINTDDSIFYTGTPVEKFLFQLLKESVDNGTIISKKGGPPESSFKRAVRYFLKIGFVENFSMKNNEQSIADGKRFIRNQVLSNQCGDDRDHYLEALAAIYAVEAPENITVADLAEIFDFIIVKNLLFDCGLTRDSLDFYMQQKVKRDIIATLPEEPRDYFPLARCLKRKFILHVGPTNSGKTYESLLRFKNSGSGVYLAPLRLLALEVQEKMLEQSLLCNLSTGEEEQLIEGSRHLCCTIEKLNLSRIYDVAVIDECQLLEDPHRGGAWTAAILGVAAKEVHACMSPHARDLVIELIEYCGDSYEVIDHTRDTELIIQDEPFNDFSKLEKGDALIVFSRKKVLTLAASINKNTNLTCSVLFGGLPYRARRIQFHDFSEGRTDLLITTDVIGLGVNLAIKRIIFMEDTKYDGFFNRKLKPAEVIQIAGRAGRKNIYDQGYILSKTPGIFKRYHETIPDLTQAYVGLSHYIGEIEGDLKNILNAWESLDFKPPFIKSNIDTNKKLLNLIEPIALSKKHRFKAIFIPIYATTKYITSLLDQYLRMVASGEKELPFPPQPEPEYELDVKQIDELKQLEEYAKGIDLYYYISKTYGLTMDFDSVENERKKTAKGINGRLLPGELKSLKCKSCETELEWDNFKNICPSCYEKKKKIKNENYLRWKTGSVSAP